MSTRMMASKALKLAGRVTVYKNENNFGTQDVKYNEVEILDPWNGMTYDTETNPTDGVTNQTRVYVKNLTYDYKVWAEPVLKSAITSSAAAESLNKGACFVVFIVQIFGDNATIEAFDEEALLESTNSPELSIYRGKRSDAYLCPYKVLYRKVHYIRPAVWDSASTEIAMTPWTPTPQKRFKGSIPLNRGCPFEPVADAAQVKPNEWGIKFICMGSASGGTATTVSIDCNSELYYTNT